MFSAFVFKVHIFWEGHKILQIVLCSASQIYGGDFEKFWGLLRIYELYSNTTDFCISKNGMLFISGQIWNTQPDGL